MIEPEDLLEPRKAYESVLKNEHHQNVVSFYDELLEKSQIDKQANELTSKKIYELSDSLENQSKALRKAKAKNTICLVFALIFLIAGLFCIIPALSKSIWIIGVVAGIGLAVLLFIIKAKVLKKALKNIEKLIAQLEENLSKKKSEAYEQLSPLFNLYGWSMHTDLVHKTVPLFDMDKFFDVSRLSYLQDSFGYQEDEGDDESTLYVQSGAILGNPFVIETAKIRSIIQQEYTGSVTYSYRVTVPDGKGGLRTEIRSETLTASIYKPKPVYNRQTWLTYGNEAAPDLTFSRQPTSGHLMKEKELEKFIEKETKKLEKKAEKEMSKGFTPMANNKFESLFHAYNRDHETQFRLLFTPLAQTNMCDLMLSKEPYGDDFSIIKNHKINKVMTLHAQRFDYTGDMNNYIHFDYRKCRENFIKYNDEYFKNFFFDFAPLMNIPLYHQYVTDEYIFNKKGKTNVTNSEAEVLANKLNPMFFKPQNCATDIILKSKHIASDDNLDTMSVSAYGYQTFERVEKVNKMGADGHFHTINVHWIEYVPVSKETTFDVQKHEIDRQAYLQNQKEGTYNEFINNKVLQNAIIFNRGLCGFIPKAGVTSSNELILNNLLKR